MLLAALSSLSVFAGDKFTFTHEGKTLSYEVIDAEAATCQVTSNDDKSKYSGDIVIPEYATSNGVRYSVIAIGDYAFDECTNLTSVAIPNSVTVIEYQAFAGCTGLTSITIPNSVTAIYTDAFNGCTGLTSVSIPNSVTIIENRAFAGCTGLTSITIPSSVDKIGEGLFRRDTKLKTIRVSKSIRAFWKSKLEEQAKEENEKRAGNPIRIVYF